MAILTILEYPDERLREVGVPVETVDDALRTFIDDMFDTMYESKGVGLAATQVNVQKRIFVMDLSEDKSDPMVFINPEITPLTDEVTEYGEGCLSVPGFYESLDRPAKVRVKALDRNGEPFEVECEGLMAVCVQHETDHLDGKLFVDYLSKLKRERIRKKLEKQHRLMEK
ncbi:peptide deformylase [Kistimonas scapharcae]|uniref:Peptide deformylase n=1 Tax=Kistimonas scapharcae TaxID=1036133 RepID=A0ABP8V5A8_9GAMM